MTASTRSKLGFTIAVLVAAGCFALIDAGLNALQRRALAKNFDVVREGVLYRAGQINGDRLERVLDRAGIRTVVRLNPGDHAEEERIVTGSGRRFVTFNMPGSGEGDPDDFKRLMDLLADPGNHPVLVHCAAGAYRTGVSVALYRILFENRSFDLAVSEMKCYGYTGEANVTDHLRLCLERIDAERRARYRMAGASFRTDQERIVSAPNGGRFR